MHPDDVLEIFRESQALLTGHFRLSSGRHSDRYLQCALVLQHPDRAERLARALAESVRPLNPQAVVSPALGGVVVGQELGRALGVRAVFTERNRETDAMELRRGFTVTPGERFFAVEDVVTTGKSVKEAAAVVRALGGEIVGVGALVDRSGCGETLFDAPFRSLLSLPVQSWEEGECPLCREGRIPVVKPGSRLK